jgi:rod shape-determining protein MreC
MQQLISFLFKNKYFLIFLLLELLAFFFTVQSHSYHRTKFINSANFITGGIYNKVNNFKEYLFLKEENTRLAEENVRLKNLLGGLDVDSLAVKTAFLKDSSLTRQKFKFISAKIINNEYNKSNNYLTLNKGTKAGLAPDLGVINSKGIIGITKSISGNYATVMSILNMNSKINVKILHKDHYGSLSWDAKDYNTVQLLDLPVQASIIIGDTIITGGMSTIFPEGIPVGVIKDFSIKNNRYEHIDISLFNDMSAIGFVEVIRNFDTKEIKELEEESINE